MCRGPGLGSGGHRARSVGVVVLVLFLIRCGWPFHLRSGARGSSPVRFCRDRFRNLWRRSDWRGGPTNVLWDMQGLYIVGRERLQAGHRKTRELIQEGRTLSVGGAARTVGGAEHDAFSR